MGKKSSKINKTLTLILVIAFVLSIINVPVYAAKKKVKLTFSKTSLSVTAGKTVKNAVKDKKNKYKKIRVSLSKKGIAKVTVKGKKLVIKGLKAGKVKVVVKAYDKKNKLLASGSFVVKVKKAQKKNQQQNTTEQKNPQQNTTEQKKPDQNTTEQNTTEQKDPDNTSGGDGKPSSETTKYDAGEYSISKSHSGEGTFYDRASTGAANLDDFESKYLTAAMNNEDYMNGLAGAYIEVTDKDGDKVKVLITDRLPEGKKGDIDLTRKAFKTIEPEKTGRMKITWKIIPLPTTDPVAFLWKPTSTQYWAEVQVRNGRYPIKSVEYYDTTSKSYKKMERKEYNYFAAASGMGSAGPYKFRITDFYGHTIIEENISIKTDGKPVNGKNNFPY